MLQSVLSVGLCKLKLVVASVRENIINMHLVYYRELSRSGRGIPVCSNDIEINGRENKSRERFRRRDEADTERNWSALGKKRKKKRKIKENYALLQASHAI